MNDENRYLCFTLGAELFGLPLLAVKEVLARPELTPVPHTPAYFLGVMNLRGQVISVMDLRARLGIKAQGAEGETVVVICRLGAYTVGIVVDSVHSVLHPTPEQILGEISGAAKQEYITGVYRQEKSLVLLLNVAKALGLERAGAAAAA